MTVLCMGVLILDMFPGRTGVKLVDVPSFRPAPGGAPANVAVAVRRLGGRSGFIGKVGDDLFGHHLADVLEKEGVDVSGVRYDAEARTTMNLHAVLPDGDFEYLFYRNPGADTRLKPEELDLPAIRRASVLHYDSLNLTGGSTVEATRKAVQAAKEGGALISFDVNYRKPVWASADEAIRTIREAIPTADIVKLNEGELKLLYPGKTAGEALRDLRASGPRLCVATLGGEGCCYSHAAGEGEMRALSVDVVDPVGCGDSFAGAMLQKFLESKTKLDELNHEQLRSIISFATASSAITATRHGAMPSLPLRKEVDEMLQERTRTRGA
jgi:fructokinase